MTQWVVVRADELASGDRILWVSARTIESVAGNADRIVITLEDDHRPITFGRAAPVWRDETTRSTT